MHIACIMCLLYFAYVTPRDLVNCPYGINKVSEMEIEILIIYIHILMFSHYLLPCSGESDVQQALN